MGELIKRVYPDTQVTVTTGGGVENLPRVANGLADIGFTQANILMSGRAGEPPFDAPIPGVSALGFLSYVPQAFFLVKEGSPYQSIEQIAADKAPIRLVVPPRNNGAELILRRLFAQMGITYEDITSWGGSVAFMNFGEASGLISDGHADAYVGSIVGSVQELLVSNDMRMLTWPDTAIEGILKDGYARVTVPAGQWNFLKDDASVPALQNVLVVADGMDPDLVASLAQILSTHEREIRASAAMYANFSAGGFASLDDGMLHPGAKAYFAERDGK